MEEKTIKLNPKKGTESKSNANQKLTPEQMTQALNNAYNVNMQLNKKVRELQNEVLNYRRNEFYVILDWLWKVINNDNTLITPEFKKECAERFMAMMTPPARDNNKEEEESNKE